MRSVLEELYMGNIGFDSGHYPQNSPFVKAAGRKLLSMEQLEAALNGSERELFEKYCDAQSEMEEITRYDTFVRALSLGMLLMAEILLDQRGVGEE